MAAGDDILHPEYLEKVLEILNREKKIFTACSEPHTAFTETAA